MSGHFRNACLGQHQGHQSRWNSRTHAFDCEARKWVIRTYTRDHTVDTKTSQLKDPSSKYHPSHPKCSYKKSSSKESLNSIIVNHRRPNTRSASPIYNLWCVCFFNIFGLTHVRPTAPPDVMMSKNLNLNLYDWVSDWLELHGVSNAGSLQLPG